MIKKMFILGAMSSSGLSFASEEIWWGITDSRYECREKCEGNSVWDAQGLLIGVRWDEATRECFCVIEPAWSTESE